MASFFDMLNWCVALLWVLGNFLRYVNEKIYKPTPFGPHGVTAKTAGVSVLAHHLFHFEITSQVPELLSEHVTCSKKAQENWYTKLLVAWKAAEPLPKTPEEAAGLILQALRRHQRVDVEGLLAFYGLPPPQAPLETSGFQSPWPQGVKFEFLTLPVDKKDVADGDSITVYVDTKYPKDSSSVPRDIQDALIQRSKARAMRNYEEADALRQSISDAGYRFIKGRNNEDIVAQRYRIRLRGIDAPEIKMFYGKEAKQELVKLVQGKCLKIHVYEEDHYCRYIGDVYCDGIFVQEVMLKKGLAWHYTTFDRRSELAMWEREARSNLVGLWASPNPKKPWEWRRKDRREIADELII